jgi:hypothetical protein
LTTLTLFTKAYNQGQLKQIEGSLQEAFEDLDAQVKVLSGQANKWVKVEVTGEDEGVAKSYIAKHIGVCPASIEDIAVGSELRGYIQKMDNPDFLIVDVGVTGPKAVYGNIPLAALQKQLVGNQQVSLKRIAEIFAFNVDLPVSIKVNELHVAEASIDAEFSAAQVDKLKNWQDSLLDRLIILGTTADDVTVTLERTRLTRDVIGVEALGLFEHVLTCKLGTDAAGLIPRIGRYMRNARFVIFNPKRLAGFSGE